MKNQINFVEIKNFKTIKHVKFDTRRINIFVGKPNVGKSNLLEALGLVSFPFLRRNDSNNISNLVRFNQLNDLFFDKKTEHVVSIKTNNFSTYTHHHPRPDYYSLIVGQEDLAGFIEFEDDYDKMHNNIRGLSSMQNNASETVSVAAFLFDANGTYQHSTMNGDFIEFVKKYDFVKVKEFNSRFQKYLLPPYGNNLFNVIHQSKKLTSEISSLFKEYNLKFILLPAERKLCLQKQVGNVAYQTDYFLSADTLQRYIFYLLAIETNKDSVLLFEEPEAHCFPKYVSDFAEKVIADKTNQFFITTHSPYVLNTIVEGAKPSDVAVFKVDYEKYRTTVRQYSEKELSHALNFGNDIIFTL